MTFQKLIFLLILTSVISRAQVWTPTTGQIPGVTYTGIASDVSSNNVLVSTLNNGIYRSNDMGQTWQHVFATADSIYSLYRIDDGHFIAGGKGFSFTSSDSGSTWSTNAFPFNVALSRFALHSSGALVAATGSKWDNNSIGGNGVWLSNDSGLTWTPINNGISMTDPLIESMAITPNGEILIGIFDGNVGINGKHGIQILDSLGGTWHRVSISVDAPFNQTYPDQDLRIGSVFNISIVDNQVIACIEGVFINFAYGFTIQKSIDDLSDASVFWNVKWVIDSIASTTSFYENIVNLFKDSQGTMWASVAAPSNEIHNNIYTGDLLQFVPWTINMGSIAEQTGRFLFAESSGGQLYAISYFLDDSIYTLLTNTGVNDITKGEAGNWYLYPQPAGDVIQLARGGNETDLVKIKIFDETGRIHYDNVITSDKIITLDVAKLHSGLYFITIENEKVHQTLKFVKME